MGDSAAAGAGAGGAGAGSGGGRPDPAATALATTVHSAAGRTGKLAGRGASLGKKAKWLLPHEQQLLEEGLLRNITHKGASSVWLTAPSTDLGAAACTAPLQAGRAGASFTRGGPAGELEGSGAGEGGAEPSRLRRLLYRPMGDAEAACLLASNQLPDTQPYQAVIEGPGGRVYAEKYLNGRKWVDSSPSTVVEFQVPAELVSSLFAMQHKAEDGAISMGLGHKAGKGLPLLNAALLARDATWRIVHVKRGDPKRLASKHHGPKGRSGAPKRSRARNARR